jgi:hypothetical protein
MPEPTTERALYLFKVKQYGDGSHFIMLEPWDHMLSVFTDGFLGFDLPKGTTLEEAETVARDLQDRIKFVTYTHL